MVFVLLGAPGSGKGTQAKNFVEKIGYKHISTGDLLRHHVAQKTELGIKIKSLMDSGQYVSDDIVFSLVEETVAHLSDPNKLVVDGIPRTKNQVNLLDKLLKKLGVKLEAVFDIHLDDEVILSRALERLVCSSCGTVYNKTSLPPKKEGVCDVCGHSVNVRADDNEETIRKRLATHYQTVQPIVQYYKEQGLWIRIDGSLSSEKVWASISSYL